jgi:hypothetical protein
MECRLEFEDWREEPVLTKRENLILCPKSTKPVFSLFMTKVACSRRVIPAIQAENGDYRHIVAAAGCLEM